MELTYHHLIPRKVHRRRHFQKNYSRQQLQQGILVCRLCHKGIHKLIDEMTLAREYTSTVRLLAHPALQRHIQWVRQQKY
ncbi:MAG: hypothetical protein KJO24_04045 [Gammaproteobacteria bacterium]|nr:hypothetical protein [Gammaproteobacteria bacterium]